MHNAAHSQSIWTCAVVTMRMLQLYNNFNLFVSSSNSADQTRVRQRVRVQLGNKGPSLNELSNTQLDFINPHNPPVVCRSKAHKHTHTLTH